MQHNYFNPKFIIQILLFGVIITAVLNVQTILDRYALATFRPDPEIAAIVDRLKLTSKAMAILARSEPVIDDKVLFNRDCQTSKGELELGCYVNGHIFVLKIENADLAPEMDVVLAHELLHAAYDRLGSSGKAAVNLGLEAAFAKNSDPDLGQRMKEYETSEPGQKNNELHSIFGTEYGSLDTSLESHYLNYFEDRKVIVAAQKQYQNVFVARRRSLDVDLAGIRVLKSQLTVLNRRMESLKNSESIAAYNSLVPQQNQLVDNINTRIKIYQQGVDEYNALSKSLDSQQITGPAESTVQ